MSLMEELGIGITGEKRRPRLLDRGLAKGQKG
jgi:hypothetical protein